MGSRPKNGRRTSTTDANEIPSEYKVEVDRIFFDFLGSICSNCGCFPRNTTRVLTNRQTPSLHLPLYRSCLVDATDAKGETIHQTLMAKKMQRLDESPDFRPFKFRIQAFTNAFLEEVGGLAATE
jgi:hypothetical protein